jgi:hypothetical protein
VSKGKCLILARALVRLWLTGYVCCLAGELVWGSDENTQGLCAEATGRGALTTRGWIREKMELQACVRLLNVEEQVDENVDCNWNWTVFDLWKFALCDF